MFSLMITIIIIQWQMYSSLSKNDKENSDNCNWCIKTLFCARLKNLLGWLKTLFHWINWNVLFDNHKSLFDDNCIPHYPINIKRIGDKCYRSNCFGLVLISTFSTQEVLSDFYEISRYIPNDLFS